MRVLLDTNVILRFVEAGHSQHALSAEAIDSLRKSGDELAIVPQTVYEFWSVATRPVDQNGLGMSIDECEAELTRASRLFSLLRDERTVFKFWRQLVAQYEVKGKKSHDARLVAAMLRHGIDRLLTFNQGDFMRYSEIDVLTPQDVIAT